MPTFASLLLLLFVAVLQEAISHVVRLSPKEQMGRVAAQGIVAAVQHEEAVWYRSYVKLVCESVRGYEFLSDPHIPVPMRPLCARP